MTINQLKGTGVALATPFSKDGKVDFAALERLVRHTAQGGVDYLVALGTTAETPVLSATEKQDILDCIKRSNTQKLPVVVGIGGNNTAEITDKIKHAALNEITAILSVSPYYNRPSQQGLYEHFKAIGEASPIPVILYNVPGRTGVNILPETALRLAKDVPNIAAIKEASGSIAQAAAILRDKPDDFIVLSGDDGMTVPFMALGAQGLISVVANAFPAAVSTMVKAMLCGDYPAAAKIQLTMQPIVDACFAEGNPAGVKAALSILGIADNCLRLPLVPVSSALMQKIETLIKANTL